MMFWPNGRMGRAVVGGDEVYRTNRLCSTPSTKLGRSSHMTGPQDKLRLDDVFCNFSSFQHPSSLVHMLVFSSRRRREPGVPGGIFRLLSSGWGLA